MLVHPLHMTWPWPPELAPAATEHMSAWTPSDRATFEERFARYFPRGIHWPN
jgi:hypothetical protein